MNVRRIARQVQGALRNFLVFCGVDQYKRREDRRVLEQVIFPYFLQRPEFARVLFVGCGWYTKVYNKMFRGKDYWTLEVNPALRKYGARQHITDSVENVHLQFCEGGLDLIICNGVFGWGLDARDEVDAAFAACFTCLRENGLLIVGWDDVPEHRPFPLGGELVVGGVQCLRLSSPQHLAIPDAGREPAHLQLLHQGGTAWGLPVLGVTGRSSRAGGSKKVRALPPLRQTLVEPAPADALELDELWSFVQRRANKQWVWLALCRRTRQVVAYAVGDRGKATCRRLWGRVPPAAPAPGALGQEDALLQQEAPDAQGLPVPARLQPQVRHQVQQPKFGHYLIPEHRIIPESRAWAGHRLRLTLKPRRLSCDRRPSFAERKQPSRAYSGGLLRQAVALLLLQHVMCGHARGHAGGFGVARHHAVAAARGGLLRHVVGGHACADASGGRVFVQDACAGRGEAGREDQRGGARQGRGFAEQRGHRGFPLLRSGFRRRCGRPTDKSETRAAKVPDLLAALVTPARSAWEQQGLSRSSVVGALQAALGLFNCSRYPAAPCSRQNQPRRISETFTLNASTLNPR